LYLSDLTFSHHAARSFRSTGQSSDPYILDIYKGPGCKSLWCIAGRLRPQTCAKTQQAVLAPLVPASIARLQDIPQPGVATRHWRSVSLTGQHDQPFVEYDDEVEGPFRRMLTSVHSVWYSETADQVMTSLSFSDARCLGLGWVS
jgi:hypothetical protein